MTRALFSTYSSKLFQVTRRSDSRTQDVSVTSAGGRVDLATLNSFCPSGTTCGISILYDQTGNGNDLSQTLQNKMPTVAFWTTKTGTSLPYCLTQASADDGAIPGNGGQFLRNRLSTQKIPTGSQPTTEYMVVYTKYYQGHCCYDYGNMEAIKGESASLRGTGNNGPGTMFALYMGQTRDWTVGAGNGPWGMVDMEDGVYSGGESNGSGNNKDPSFAYPGTNIVAVLAKTNGTSSFVLKVSDMESTAGFVTPWNGNLPGGYAPLRLEGGLSLGEGGDGSNNVDGAFFEGFVVAGEEADTTDTSIQSNLHSYFTQ
jgi:non-reducing end alpha-L-arabinofuranosidase